MIVNKASNSGRALKEIEKHSKLIKETLTNVELYQVKENESISEIASKKARSFDVIVACGGDGTARNVAIGIKDQDVLFGILPIGSGNDFAKMLGLTDSFENNLKKLKLSNTRSLDIIQVNEIYFINTLGIGFDGLANYLATQAIIKGGLKYVFAGLKALIKTKSFEVTINKDTEKLNFKTLMLIVANGKWEGGKYFVSPTSKNNDGILELIILNNITRVRLAIEFIRLSFGKSLSTDLYTLIPIVNAKIKTSHLVYSHSDGEVNTMQNQFNINIVKNKIKVIISPS